MAFLRLRTFDRVPGSFERGAVAVGNFDGVHRGHQKLVRAARQLARPAIAVTFDPPPTQLLYPGREARPLTTLDERAELLRQAGADEVAVLTAEAELLSLSAEAFFEEVIGRLFRAVAVAEGTNFRFGRNRTGDTATLAQLCARAGLAFQAVEPELDGDLPVSSSRVRDLLAGGRVADAGRLLGRPHRVTGVVEPGARRGRTLGFPTANLGQVATLLPLEGVYAGTATVAGSEYPAVANLGPAPTFAIADRKLEVHLLDFDGDLYNSSVRFSFRDRLRGVQTFVGRDALVAQLDADVARARELLTQPEATHDQ